MAERRITEITRRGGTHLLLAMLFAALRTLYALEGPEETQLYVTQAMIELNTPASPPEPEPPGERVNNPGENLRPFHTHRRANDPSPPSPPEAA